MEPQSSATSRRPLNVNDGLTYLDDVKAQFQDQPAGYEDFLNIMRAFRKKQLKILGVVDRIVGLFSGHPALIQGFNMFLPAGYHVECSTDPSATGFITVTMPGGRTMQATAYTSAGGGQALSWSTGPAPAKGEDSQIPLFPG
ncbi:hypothetical protein HYPSUDRAFT_186885 [Hypholoma sublateritium FD-334 SS-4]|uniref:Histone deacetylase interacting domain-containing protein n=1 Tax=Hypholoma sublateritium (strain FD-334 SS-4) TaxID=945553 RepID=A0A0D2MDX8_HYPSF|nr:hypothetical protein HYPSUDRAFT_186885 [Hypholoma sublateritium FD-334 SS-4]